MTRTALNLRDGQMEKLRTLSASSGAGIAELIRRAVDHYLEVRKADIFQKK